MIDNSVFGNGANRYDVLSIKLRVLQQQSLTMHICLDVDDTITYAPSFFAGVCDRFAEARVTILTFRADKRETEQYLDSVGVRYDQVIVSTDPDHGKSESQPLHEWKASFVNRLKPDIFFEDMPEVVASVDASILVFMPCDEVIRQWITAQLENPSASH